MKTARTYTGIYSQRDPDSYEIVPRFKSPETATDVGILTSKRRQTIVQPKTQFLYTDTYG